MIRDIFFDMDQYFQSAYKDHQADPDPEVWNKISAWMDRDEAERYKRKFRQWKTLALLLLFLTGGYLAFQGLLQKDPKLVFRPFPQKRSAGQQTPTGAGPANLSHRGLEKHNDRPYFKNIPSGPVLLKRAEAELSKIAAVACCSVPSMENEDMSRSCPVISPDSVKQDILSTNTQQSTAAVWKKAPFKKNWSLTGSASIDMAEYRIDNDLPQGDVKSMIEGRESHNASFSFSVLANYQFCKKWALQTGFRYSNILIGIDPHEIYAVYPAAGNPSYKYVTSSGYAFIQPGFQTAGDSLQTTSARHHLVFVSLPVMLKYIVGKARWTLMPSFGIQLNYLARAAVKTEIQNGSQMQAVSIHRLTGEKTFYLSYVAEAGLAYRVNPRWSVNAVPSFQYGVTSITRDNVVNTFPYSLGLDLGLTYHF